MKKLGTYALIGAAAAGMFAAGAGVAAAETAPSGVPIVAPGEPDPSGTGSSSLTTTLAQLLSSLSAGGGTTTPTTPAAS